MNMKNSSGLLFVSFSFLSFLLIAGCAGTGAISQRGTVVVSGESVKAFAAGPAVVHAYSQDRGGKVFLVSAVSGTDADCARDKLPADGASVPVDAVETLTVGPNQVACLATSGPRAYELLWHAKASAPASFQLASAKTRR